MDDIEDWCFRTRGGGKPAFLFSVVTIVALMGLSARFCLQEPKLPHGVDSTQKRVCLPFDPNHVHDTESGTLRNYAEAQYPAITRMFFTSLFACLLIARFMISCTAMRALWPYRMLQAGSVFVIVGLLISAAMDARMGEEMCNDDRFNCFRVGFGFLVLLDLLSAIMAGFFAVGIFFDYNVRRHGALYPESDFRFRGASTSSSQAYGNSLREPFSRL